MDANEADIFKGLTKGQKKKLKEKLKKEAEAKAQTDTEGKTAEEIKQDKQDTAEPAKPAPQPAKGAKGKGKKAGKSAAAKLLQQKMEEKKREEEERQREEEAERQKILEEERIKREEKKKRKEEEKAKKEELKKQGQLISKKEQEEKERLDQARQNLIDQGLIDASVFEEGKDEKPKQKIVYNTKKKKNKNKAKPQDPPVKPTPVADNSESVSTPSESTKPQNPQPEDAPKAAKAEEGIKEIDNDLKMDDWEDLDDDENIDKQVAMQVDETLLKEQANKVHIQESETQDQEEEKVSSSASEVKAKHDTKTKPKGKDKKDKQEAEETTGGSIFDMSARVVRKKGNKKQNKKAKAEEVKTDPSERKFRCPIICVLGHVDTGKTLLLDKIRRTNVQKGEAGGITQQIGATYFPGEALQKNVDKLDDTFDCKEVKIPGLLVIDTPGHESFTNLRSRGSGLCDLAILVVDLMHGLEQQTLESIELLRQKKTPFIVALNKIDRCHMWETEEYRSSRAALDAQESTVKDEYESRRDKAFLEFNERGMNIQEYWINEDYNTYINAVPTSAMTGEGIPDILGMVVKFCQTKLKNKITERNTEFQCTVLEVKKIPGVGTTVDVVLVNGKLAVNDTIVLAGFNGPIVTKIRALLTPHPMKEIRVKGDYIHHKELYGAMGIKISAPDLDHALAGGELLKAEDPSQIDDLCDEIQETMMNFAEKYVNAKDEGVCVQASTLGSLEALLEFLKSSKIPVCSVNIGPVYKKDVMKALKFLENPKSHREYASILAFDVEVDDEAVAFAEEYNIKIFTANIIYHLFDQFTDYVKECEANRKQSLGAKAVFPCAIEIIKDNIFHKTDPILLGVNVKAGVLKIGTPLCVPDRGFIKIGVVDGIQKGGKDVTSARQMDGGVSLRIKNDKHITAGKHFTEDNQLVSLISRDSIDSLKEHFKDEMTMDDWRLVKKLKEVLQIL